MSKIGLKGQAVSSLALAVSDTTALAHLDISSNFIEQSAFIDFFSTLTKHSILKSLNISYNSFSSTEDTLEQIMAKYLHISPTLLHLDISGVSMAFSQLCYIAARGLRKSMTLVSVHMNNLGLSEKQVMALRTILKVDQIKY